MSTAFVIIHNNNIKTETLNDLTEVIRSKFISKKSWNMFIISSININTSKEIYDFVQSKIKVEILVIKLDSYFGNFETGIAGWLKETFPNVNYIE